MFEVVAFSVLMVFSPFSEVWSCKFVDPRAEVGTWAVDIGRVGAAVGVHVVYVDLVVDVGVEECEPLEGLGVCGEGFVSHVGDIVDGSA